MYGDVLETSNFPFLNPHFPQNVGVSPVSPRGPGRSTPNSRRAVRVRGARRRTAAARALGGLHPSAAGSTGGRGAADFGHALGRSSNFPLHPHHLYQHTYGVSHRRSFWSAFVGVRLPPAHLCLMPIVPRFSGGARGRRGGAARAAGHGLGKMRPGVSVGILKHM